MSKYLIIGGVAGGMSTAARLRRMDENAEIIVFEKGEYISFANCGLPYYIGGEIQDRDELLLQTPPAFYARFNVDIRTRTEAISIQRDKKTITLKNLENGKTYTESYDKLVLSPGADPVRPPIPGIDHPAIFTLRNIPDTDKITAYLREKKPHRAVVIGGGYIGLEMAENLHRRGLEITLVEALPQVLNMLDFEMAAIVHHHLRSRGVSLHLNEKVTGFKTGSDGGLNISLAGGNSLEADMVILAIGVKPGTALAGEAGLKLGERGGIAVNSCLMTSDPDIYALGDAAEVENPISGAHTLIPLAGPANKQGRIVADNIAEGNKSHYRGTRGAGVLKVFELTVAMTGLSTKTLRTMETDSLSTIVMPMHHAGYYPGAAMLYFKILFRRESGSLLGAQIIGQEGVEKRLDVISAFMQKEGTVYDLAEFEQCYAPPYSSAKDPVNLAGFVACNMLEEKIKTVDVTSLPESERNILFLDVRTPEEVAEGTIPGALNIPLDEIRQHIHELDPSRKIIVFCRVGMRGYLAARILMQRGFREVYNLSGGYTIYNFIKQETNNQYGAKNAKTLSC